MHDALTSLRTRRGGSFDHPCVTARLRRARRSTRRLTCYAVVPEPSDPPEYGARYGAPQQAGAMR